MNSKVEKKKLDICHFHVPVIIQLDEDGKKQASFKEVEHKNLCYKIDTEEFETSTEAMALAERLNQKNKQTLKLAAMTKNDGDTITRIILCDHGSVVINININK